jgi:hypothetical protein
MAFDPEPILQGVLATLPRCPLCGETGTLGIVKSGKRMGCSACKARWCVFRRTPGGAFTELALDKRGTQKIGQELWGKQKSFEYWRALPSDPRPTANLALIEQLLADLDSAFSGRLEQSEAFEQAMAGLAGISAVGRAELEAIAVDPDHPKAFTALWYLTECGDSRWIPTLKGRLDDPNPPKRVAAIDQATFLTEQTGNQALIGDVVDRLATDPDPAVRMRAALHLRRAQPTPPVVEALWQALADSEKPLKQPLIDLAGMADLAKGEWRNPAIGAVGFFMDAVREGAAMKRPKPTIGEVAWASLRQFGARIRSELDGRMDSSDRRVRAEAACLIATLGDSSAVDQLIETLDELEPARRLEAARALADLGAEEGRTELGRLGGVGSDIPVWIRREARTYLEGH